MKDPKIQGIIGHERTLLALEKMLKAQTLSHAVLFIGPEGIGKTTLAKTLGDILLDASFDRHPDAQYIERLSDEKTGKRKTVISVEQIRELKERLQMSSIAGGAKVVIISEADRLHMSAANALLKTLEEPKGDTYIFLLAESTKGIPQTILSRAQHFSLKPASSESIITALKKKGLGKSESESLANMSFGRPGYALRFLTDGGFRAEYEIAGAQFLRLLSASIPERIAEIGNILPKSEEDKRSVVEQVLVLWQAVLRDLLLCSSGNEDKLRFLSEKDQLVSASKQKSAKEWGKLIDRASDVHAAIKQNTNPQIALEHLILAL